MFKVWGVIIGLAAILAGCAYSQFYHANPNLQPNRVELTPGVVPQVYRYGADIQADDNRLLEAGYYPIGYSSFNAADIYADGAGAKSKGKELGAQIVMLKSEHSHTITSTTTLPVESPGETVTSTTSGTVYAPGHGKIGTFGGTTTTYIPGETTYRTYTTNTERFDFLATYWAKAKPPRFGAFVDELSPDLRSKYQRNTGVVIRALVKDSPAFKANLLRGDIIIRMGGEDVTAGQQYESLIDKYAGRATVVDVIRDDRPLQFRVQFNPNPH